MKQSDVEAVYAIEVKAHRAPWTRGILGDCVLVGYDCRVLELISDKVKYIAGYIICRYNLQICHILNICVKNNEQGKGYGHLLLDSLISSLDKAVISSIILEVRPSNSVAIHLYKKFGFDNKALRKSYYKDDKGEEDALILNKELK